LTRDFPFSTVTSSKTKGHDPSVQLSNRGMTIVNKSNATESLLHHRYKSIHAIERN